jgi:hypothetical protein
MREDIYGLQRVGGVGAAAEQLHIFLALKRKCINTVRKYSMKKNQDRSPSGLYTSVIMHLSKITQDVGYYTLGGPNLSKLCVPYTFEFLISATPYLQTYHLGGIPRWVWR